MSDRCKMQVGDWLNGAAILAAGVFLGIAIDAMLDLAGTAFWPLIILIPVLIGGGFLGVLFFDRLVDRFFPSGIRPASRPGTGKRRPLALLLSLPAGIIIGVIGAQLGVSDMLLQGL